MKYFVVLYGMVWRMKIKRYVMLFVFCEIKCKYYGLRFNCYFMLKFILWKNVWIDWIICIILNWLCLCYMFFIEKLFLFVYIGMKCNVNVKYVNK